MDNTQSIWFIFLSFLLSEKSPRQDLQDLISITHRWTNYNWYFVVIRFKLNIVILRVRSKIITHALLNFTREKFYIAFTTKKRNNNSNNNQPSSAKMCNNLPITVHTWSQSLFSSFSGRLLQGRSPLPAGRRRISVSSGNTVRETRLYGDVFRNSAELPWGGQSRDFFADLRERWGEGEGWHFA